MFAVGCNRDVHGAIRGGFAPPLLISIENGLILMVIFNDPPPSRHLRGGTRDEAAR